MTYFLGMLRKSIICPVLLVALFLYSCAKTVDQSTAVSGASAWEVAKKYAYRYLFAEKRSARLALAKAGVESAEECIRQHPNEAGCYYYHAVNTGQYYQSKVVGYQNGLKTMVDDAHRVISLDPSFEYGGGYRILGQIFTEVPASAIRPDSVTKDLDMALVYLNKALKIAPEYPENYIYLSTTYKEMDDKEKARDALNKAEELLPAWRNSLDYRYWKKCVTKLNAKID